MVATHRDGPAAAPQQLGGHGDVLRGALVSSEPLSIDAAVAATTTRRTGGLGLFLGLVREVDEGKQVSSLDYTAHPSARDELAAATRRAIDGHDVETAYAAHRTGHLEVGELAVVVAVGAVHRKDALEACHAVIDEVKRSVPIWKEQFVLDGSSHWVGAASASPGPTDAAAQVAP